MSRLEQRAVIRCLTLKGLSADEIATELQSVYCTDALRYAAFSKWRLYFQDGSDDLFGFTRSGRHSRTDPAAAIQSRLETFPFI
jgi:transposase